MEYLDCQVSELESGGGFNTANEISAQPELWMETFFKLLNEKEKVSHFVGDFLKKDHPEVILTGAGTSAFIGDVLVGPLKKKWGISCRAISTTDIITHPGNYFIRSRPTLLISFARSGDSPESVATVKLAREYCEDLYELNVTCNKSGELARQTGDINSYVFLLPEGTNDRSLAMTSSFSSMLLAGLLIINIMEIGQMGPLMEKLQRFGNFILNECLSGLKQIAEMDFQRMVFLGSGPLLGVAHESQLKVQELSDGNVIGVYDSFLGFRHGPKALVNNATVVVYLLSNNAYARLYELDLIRSMNMAGEKTVAIGNGYDQDEFHFDFSIRFPGGTEDFPEDFLPVFYVLPAQIIGFYKSLKLGLSPDSPSKSFAITRVVQGVKIYSPDFNCK